jgi:putative spermidine/putrescine transport system permease protein
VTLQIAGSLQSEVVIGQENVGKALALGMIVVVSLVMALYALIQRRASRWVK